MRRVGWIAFLAGAASLCTTAAAAPSLDVDLPAPTLRDDALARAFAARLPAAFEVNRGQAPEGWDFLVRCSGYHAFVRSTGIVFSMDGAALALTFEGAAASAPETSRFEQPGRVNYLIGNDRALWLTDVPTTRGASYPGAIPGVTWTASSRARRLEFTFVVQPGADVPRLRLDGGSDVRVAKDGHLLVAMPHGEAAISPPLAWQVLAGRRVACAARWSVAEDGAVAIEVVRADAASTLHVDPTVTYATCLVGTDAEYCAAAAADSAGSAFVGGSTDSANFPTTSGAFDRSSSSTDAFVAKIASDGQTLIWSTYLGGTSPEEVVRSVLLDGTGEPTLGVSTYSTNYPVTPGAFQSGGNAAITRLNAAGNGIVFSTFVQGYSSRIAFGSAGTIYAISSIAIARYTAGGTSQVFYRQLLPTGPLPNGSFRIADGCSDDQGYAYVAGDSSFTKYGSTAGAFQTSIAGDRDVFVTKIAPDGATVWSTWLGGANGDSAAAIRVNLVGQAYVTGTTRSTAFPVTGNAYRPTITSASSDDGFVTRLTANGAGLRYSTFLGRCTPYAIAVHSGSSFTVAGSTGVATFATLDPFQATLGGGSDALVMKFSRGNALLLSSFCGGTGTETAESLAMGPDGSCILAGGTTSADFPTVAPIQSASGTSEDAFVLRLPDTLPVVTRLAVSTSSLPTWTVGYEYSQTFSSTGGIGPYTWSRLSGTLPPGLTLTPVGLFAGTPTATGDFTFTVAVDDAAELHDEREFTLSIQPPPSVPEGELPGLTLDTPCDRAMQVLGGSPPYTWSLLAGAPPPGTSLGADGRLTGTPEQIGLFALTLGVVDGRGAAGSGSLTIRVNVPPSIVDATVPELTTQRPFSFRFGVTGGTSPFVWSLAAGALPTSLPIAAATGEISGDGRSPGAYSFRLRVTDAAGATSERAFPARVNELPSITTVELPFLAVGRPYAATLASAGGTAPLVWTLAAGVLPPGVSIDAATGRVAGVPTSVADEAVHVQVTDARGAVTSSSVVVRTAPGVDLARRRSEESLEFGPGLSRLRHRHLELLAGSVLSFSVQGWNRAVGPPSLRLFDDRGAEIDLSLATKTGSGVVSVAGVQIARTGRYFLSVEGPASERTLRLRIGIGVRSVWAFGAPLGPEDPAEFAFAAPPGARVAVTAKAAKGSAALPRIASIVDDGGADVLATGTAREKGSSASFSSKLPLSGGDYRVTFATRDGTVGPVSWTVKLKLPKTFDFALPDLAAGD